MTELPKIEPCPFCNPCSTVLGNTKDDEIDVDTLTGQFFVHCSDDKCLYCGPLRDSAKEAIEDHNKIALAARKGFGFEPSTKPVNRNKKPLALGIWRCGNHPESLSISIDDESGGRRLTPFKCCGVSNVVHQFAMSPNALREVASEILEMVTNYEEEL